MSNNEIFLTGGFLQCIIPPSQHQRVRYVRELEEEALRYITIDNDGVLTLSVCNQHSFFLTCDSTFSIA